MEPLIHLLVPTLLLYILLPKYRKWIVILSFLAFIMDFDYFIPNYHRIFFHNIFFAIICSLAFYLTIGKTQFLIALYYLLSHLVLDIGDPGYAIFYPFSKTIYGINVFIKKALATGLDYNFSLVITPFGKITEYTPSAFLTNLGIILIIFIILVFVFYKVLKK